jgi:hypothetical protein
MGWEKSLNDVEGYAALDVIEDSDPIKKTIYKAYFSDSLTQDEIIELIQIWWDQYSLPLYRMKLLKTIKTDPSLIFVIYLLALQMRMPWSDELYRISGNFYHLPQIGLLACIMQIGMIKKELNKTIRFIPGSGFKGNRVIIRRDKVEYSQSRYGTVCFTRLTEQEVELVKINKRVIITHNPNLDQIKIMPLFMPLSLNHFRRNLITFRIDDRLVHVPLVWKKAEITLSGCRIRWIFKKDRFQFTCQTNQSDKALKINDEKIDFSQSKQAKYYYSGKKSENKSGLKVFDNLGRSFILGHKTSKKEARLIGWIQDRYGLLVEKYNISFNTHQNLRTTDESGWINTSVELPTYISDIAIISKKMSETISIRKITNGFKLKLIDYLPSKRKGAFVIVIDDQLNIQRSAVQGLCLEEFGFIPITIYKSEIKNGKHLPLMIRLTKKDSLYQFGLDKRLSRSAILFVRYPEGITDMFYILSEGD